MSKKQLHSRLDELFSDLEINDFSQPTEPQAGETSSGWSWESDLNGIYTTCSAEVMNSLGVNPENFIGQSIFNFQIDPQSSVELTNLLRRSTFPCEFEAQFQNSKGTWVPVQNHCLSEKF